MYCQIVHRTKLCPLHHLGLRNFASTKSAHGSPWKISSARGDSAMAPRHFLRHLMARERPLRDRTGSRAGARKRGPALQGLEENEPEESWLGECFEDQRWA